VRDIATKIPRSVAAQPNIASLNCISRERRAVSDIQVLRSSFQIQRGAAERPASPAAHTTHQARRLADESNAIRGRVHAVVRRPVIETTQRFLPPPRKELFNARLAVSRGGGSAAAQRERLTCNADGTSRAPRESDKSRARFSNSTRGSRTIELTWGETEFTQLRV
jgi:hypothetical protein